MLKLFTVLALLTLSITLNAQLLTVSPILPFKYLWPERLTEHDKQFYMVYLNGQLSVFDAQLRKPTLVATPTNVVVVDVFSNDGLLWILSGEGHLFYYDKDLSVWTRVAGSFRNAFISKESQLFLSSEQSIWRVRKVDVPVVVEEVQRLPINGGVHTFAVRGDTILYSPRESFGFRFNVNGVDSVVISSQEFEYPSSIVEMGDGSLVVVTYTGIVGQVTGSVRDGCVNAMLKLGVSVAMSVTMGQVDGSLVLGIVGVSDSGKTVLLKVKSDLSDLSVTRVDLDADLLRVSWLMLPLDTSDIIALNNGGTVIRSPSGILVTDGCLPLPNGLGNNIQDIRSEFRDGRRATIQVNDTILVYNGGVLKPYLVLDSILKRALGEFSHFIERDGVTLAFGRSGVLKTHDGGATWQTALTGLGAAYIKPLQFHDSTIIVGNAAVELLMSTDKGQTWIKHVTDKFDRIWEVSSSDELVIMRGERSVFVFPWAPFPDTIVPYVYRSTSLIRPILLSYSGSQGRICVPLPSSVNPGVVDALRFVTLCVNGPIDSIDVVLPVPLPLPSTWTYFYGTQHRDTTIIFQPETGRLFHIVGPNVVRDVSIPLGMLHPFNYITSYTVEVEFNGTRGVLLSYAPGGISIAIDYSDGPLSSVLDQNLIMVQTLKAYPNPAQNSIMLGIGKLPAAAAEGVKLQLCSLDGRIMKDFSSQVPPFGSGYEQLHFSVDVGDVPSGAYLLVVKNSQSTHAFKIIVQRY